MSIRNLITVLLVLAGFSATAQKSSNDGLNTKAITHDGITYYVYGEIDTSQVLIQYTDTTKDLTVRVIKGYVVSDKENGLDSEGRPIPARILFWLDADKKILSGIIIWDSVALKKPSEDEEYYNSKK
jgi:hypothetical protein